MGKGAVPVNLHNEADIARRGRSGRWERDEEENQVGVGKIRNWREVEGEKKVRRKI